LDLFPASFKVYRGRGIYRDIKITNHCELLLYEDNPDSLHDLEITMKKICKVKSKDKAVIEPEVWLAAMTKQFKNATVKKVCLRLAKTPVTISNELNLLNGLELDKIAVTTIWTGAYLLLSQMEDTAKNQITETPKPKQDRKKPASTAEASSAVKFTPETKVAKKPSNRRLYISKEKAKPVAKSIKTTKRKYT
jgi:hypothetical protein